MFIIYNTNTEKIENSYRLDNPLYKVIYHRETNTNKTMSNPFSILCDDSSRYGSGTSNSSSTMLENASLSRTYRSNGSRGSNSAHRNGRDFSHSGRGRNNDGYQPNRGGYRRGEMVNRRNNNPHSTHSTHDRSGSFRGGRGHFHDSRGNSRTNGNWTNHRDVNHNKPRPTVNHQGKHRFIKKETPRGVLIHGISKTLDLTRDHDGNIDWDRFVNESAEYMNRTDDNEARFISDNKNRLEDGDMKRSWVGYYLKNLVKCSLHEVLDHPIVRGHLSRLYSIADRQGNRFNTEGKRLHSYTDRNLLHYAARPVPLKVQDAGRTQEDMIKTISIILETTDLLVTETSNGETPMDYLEHAFRKGRLTPIQTELLSLEMLDGLSDDQYDRNFRFVMSRLTEKRMESLRSAVCWLMTLDPVRFARNYAESFHREIMSNGSFENIQLAVSLLREAASRGPRNCGFAMFFRHKPWSTGYLQQVFDIISTRYSIDMVRDAFMDEERKEFVDPTVIGAIVGETGNLDTILEFVEKAKEFPSVVAICVSHAFPRLQREELLDVVRKMMNQRVLRPRERVLCLNLLDSHGKPQPVSQTKVIMDEPQQASVPSQEEEDASNPLIGRMNSLDLLVDLTKVSMEDDVVYPIEKHLSSHGVETVAEAILHKLVSIITANTSDNVRKFIDYLHNNSIAKRAVLLRVLLDNKEEIEEAVDSPLGLKLLFNVLE